MALGNKDSVGGGLIPFFSAHDHLNDLALIVEPKRFVAKGYKSKFTSDGKTDGVEAKVTVFRAQSHLDEGKPFSVGTFVFTDTNLVKDLVKYMDEGKEAGDPNPAQIVRVVHHQPKTGNRTMVFRAPREEDRDKAAEYYERREAGTKAELANVPAFKSDVPFDVE